MNEEKKSFVSTFFSGTSAGSVCINELPYFNKYCLRFLLDLKNLIISRIAWKFCFAVASRFFDIQMMIKQMMLNTLCVQMNRTILFPNILEKKFRYTHKHKGTHNYEAHTSIKERLCEERIVCVSHLTDSIPNRCDRNDEKNATAVWRRYHRPHSNHMTISNSFRNLRHNVQFYVWNMHEVRFVFEFIHAKIHFMASKAKYFFSHSKL